MGNLGSKPKKIEKKLRIQEKRCNDKIWKACISQRGIGKIVMREINQIVYFIGDGPEESNTRMIFLPSKINAYHLRYPRYSYRASDWSPSNIFSLDQESISDPFPINKSCLSFRSKFTNQFVGNRDLKLLFRNKFYRSLVFKTMGMTTNQFCLLKFVLTKTDLSRILLHGKHLVQLYIEQCIIPEQRFTPGFLNSLHPQPPSSSHPHLFFYGCSPKQSPSHKTHYSMILNITSPLLSPPSPYPTLIFKHLPQNPSYQDLPAQFSSVQVEISTENLSQSVYFTVL
ncbi:unnamed protein product [Moneuplotes crassus]|uniref:Uncharacterized protein n=1 Tax=Euplotes crassus TaxID=5936 RepID=A0AAD2D0P2_EUPCR|nr:unnamed protein product [Moneuplotes crassus]